MPCVRKSARATRSRPKPTQAVCATSPSAVRMSKASPKWSRWQLLEVMAVGFSDDVIGHDELVLEVLLALRRLHHPAAPAEEGVVGELASSRRGRGLVDLQARAGSTRRGGRRPARACPAARTPAAGRSACAAGSSRGLVPEHEGPRGPPSVPRAGGCPWPSGRGGSRRPGRASASVGTRPAVQSSPACMRRTISECSASAPSNVCTEPRSCGIVSMWSVPAVRLPAQERREAHDLGVLVGARRA